MVGFKNVEIITRGRGRPPKVEPLRMEITRIWKEHPGWTDKEIQGELRLRFIKEISNEHKDWIRQQVLMQVKERLPGTESIGRFRRQELELNQKKIDASGIDQPWSLACLSDIPSEALPAVLEVWFRTRKELLHFTIREAQWVSRLYPLCKLHIGEVDIGYDIEKLKRIAKFYAQEELLTEVSGMSFFGFNGTEGILNLYEEWKGRKFEQAERSQLLLAPIIVGRYPEDRSLAQQLHRTAELQGGSLREFRERNELAKEFILAGKEWPADPFEQYELLKQHRKRTMRHPQTKE